MLARDLGMSVARAQAEISSKEFSEWLAFWRITHDPDDRRTALLCSVIARAHGSKAAKPQQFMPRKKVPPMSMKMMKAQLARGFGQSVPKRLR